MHSLRSFAVIQSEPVAFKQVGKLPHSSFLKRSAAEGASCQIVTNGETSASGDGGSREGGAGELLC